MATVLFGAPLHPGTKALFLMKLKDLTVGKIAQVGEVAA
jgi:hypothetical protein